MRGTRVDALVGAIEGGGTKFVCAVGTGPHDLARTEFPTGDDPARVLAQATTWLRRQQQERGSLRAVGVGSFGPVDLNPDSQAYGHVTATPKRGWNNADIVGPVRDAFPGAAIAFETDVNAAAVGEYYWGSAAGLTDFVYLTIGTGIGGGALASGHVVHGLIHPEMGHMLLPRAAGDTFAGACPYHGPCWEGLCSGPALLARTGVRAEELPADHEAWAYETEYIALALANITSVLSPRRIIIGGGVRRAGRLGQEQFFRLIREKTRRAINGYLASAVLTDEIESYVVPPLLGDDAGVCGAIALAQVALSGHGAG
jgi:fructokinase